MKPSPSTNRRSVPFTLLGGLAGFVAALALAFLAVMMSGLGHGWMSPVGPTLGAFVAFVLLGIAVGMRPSKARQKLALGVLLAAFFGDLWLLTATRAEGLEYFQRALQAVPEIVVSWLVVWCGAQLLAAGICIATAIQLSREPLN